MPAPTQARVTLRRLFTGSPSVRGALGVLAYAALVLGVFPIQGHLLRRWLVGLDGVSLYLVDHLVQLVEILLFAWAGSRLERQSFAAYGLPWRLALRARFWQGAAVGIGALTTLVLALVALGGLRLSLPAHLGIEVPLAAVGYLLIFIVLGLREEFLYRGYGLTALTGQIGFWPAALVTSAWFVATHASSSGESAVGLVAVGMFGMLACLLLLRTGSLWLPIGLHAAWDWGETFLFGVSDSGHAAAPGHLFAASVPKDAPAWLSGGPTGPEGSVLCLVLLVALLVGSALPWRR